MKSLGFAVICLGLLSAVGCGDSKTEPPERTRNAVDNDVPANNLPPTPDPDAPPPSDATGPDKSVDDADLPAGVQEKPADELPKTGSEGKEDTK
jgi:hypothetical protein